VAQKWPNIIFLNKNLPCSFSGPRVSVKGQGFRGRYEPPWQPPKHSRAFSTPRGGKSRSSAPGTRFQGCCPCRVQPTHQIPRTAAQLTTLGPESPRIHQATQSHHRPAYPWWRLVQSTENDDVVQSRSPELLLN